MFSSPETDEHWLGRILKQLNNGKTLGAIMLELDWTGRAKLLINMKRVKNARQAFLETIADTTK
jgi:hypothetical protein